jgi:hypothetical protein
VMRVGPCTVVQSSPRGEMLRNRHPRGNPEVRQAVRGRPEESLETSPGAILTDSASDVNECPRP